MQYINGIPLNNNITVYEPVEGAEYDITGKKPYTRNLYNSANFSKTSHDRDNYQRETKYKHVSYTKAKFSKDSLVYLGETTEPDPSKIQTYEIREYSPMESVTQKIIGYKIWL